MAPAPDFSDPAAVVQAFIHQMHYWEGLAGSLAAGVRARCRPGGLRQYALKRQDDGWRIDNITVTLGTQKRKLTII